MYVRGFCILLVRSGSGENNIRRLGESARSAGRISVTWRTTGILYCPSDRNTQKPLNPFSRSRREKSFPTIYLPEREVDKQEHATSETPIYFATWLTRDKTGRRTLGYQAVRSRRCFSAFSAEPSQGRPCAPNLFARPCSHTTRFYPATANRRHNDNPSSLVRVRHSSEHL